MRAPAFEELSYVDRSKILRAVELARTRQIAVLATADGCWLVFDMNKRLSIAKVAATVEREPGALVGMYSFEEGEGADAFRQRLMDDLIVMGAV